MPPDANGEGQTDFAIDEIEEEDSAVTEYDISATPNDFNLVSLVQLMETGAIVVPGFQRNYVWDLRKASKLIESLLMGIPVPQIFLFEKSYDKFLVVDGQQRLMTIYYFVKQRFPKSSKRGDLRRKLDKGEAAPLEVLSDNEYFRDFGLDFYTPDGGRKNRFQSLKYETLGEHKSKFEMRTIRNVVIRQNKPEDGFSSMYEIFSRLNTGGVNASPQEIRMAMYESQFFRVLYALNLDNRWRTILNAEPLDGRMRDIEIMLRALAMLMRRKSYKPSMTKFLDDYCRQAMKNSDEENSYIRALFESFLRAASGLPPNAFVNKITGRFNVALFEAVFVTYCEKPYARNELLSLTLDAQKVQALASDKEFAAAAIEGTMKTANVDTRLRRASEVIGG